MAVPSASWPHAVFPGLSGNKGRKTPFYSITPAALGHWANTKESGFIKTISARNEPNRLIYHQPCTEYERLRGHRDTPVLRGCGCFPDSAHEGDRHLSQLYDLCLSSCRTHVSGLGLVDLKKLDSNFRFGPEGKEREKNPTLTAARNLWVFCLKAQETRNQEEFVGDINAMPARRWGFGEDSHGGGGTERMKRKVEMLPGAPNRRQTLHIWEEEQGGMRRGKERGGRKNIRVRIKEVKRKKITQKAACTFTKHKCTKRRQIHHNCVHGMCFVCSKKKRKAAVEELRQQNTLRQRSDFSGGGALRWQSDCFGKEPHC